MSLLPSDKYLALMLGLTDEQFEYFKEEVRKQNQAAPEPTVVAGIVTGIIVSLAIGIGTQVVASLLKPKPPQVDDKEKKRSTIKSTSRGGDQVTQNQRVAPRYGFDATQEIATLGSIIPIVYALREDIGGVNYGGCRANTALLWSQLLSQQHLQQLGLVLAEYNHVYFKILL